MRPRAERMLVCAGVVTHGEASALIGQDPEHPSAGRVVIADPEGDARRDTPGNPFGVSPNALRCLREASPTAIAPDAWPVDTHAWGDRTVRGFARNGFPFGENAAGPMHGEGRGKLWRLALQLGDDPRAVCSAVARGGAR